ASTTVAAAGAAAAAGASIVGVPRRPLRIVSLLPAATEMAFALGLADELVGVSHECDFPPAARLRPVVVQPAISLERLSQREIDAAVSQRLASGQSLYEIDEERLRRLQPDLVLTQDLCQVCAPSGNELAAALTALTPQPRILAMTPHTLEDVFDNLRQLGAATGRTAEAAELLARLRERLLIIRARLATNLPPPVRVLFLEWADPPYCGGHWVPEMIELAGGTDALARAGRDSVRLSWEEVQRWDPELLLLSPCGYRLEQALAQLPLLTAMPGWSKLAAVRHGQVFCVDAAAYFARPGPRVVDGAELLAHIIHPELFEWGGQPDAYRRAELGS